MIARCAGGADVRAAVRFARQTGLPVAVRGGGHSFPGLSVCDDGIVIDLSPMKGIRVDPEARTARVQAGALLADLDRETQEFGLAVPAGIVSHTGVAGLTLGGGIGWLMRKHGLTIDQLLAVDLITADGQFVKASATENAELFWGVRGGGGNFGIVTEFEFRLNRVGPIVLAGPIYWPIESSPDVLRFYRDWIADTPDELTTIVFHRTAPALPAVPAEIRGKLVVIVAAVTQARSRMAKKSSNRSDSSARRCSISADRCPSLPSSDARSLLRSRLAVLLRSCDVAELTDEVIDITAEHALHIDLAAHHLPDLPTRRCRRAGSRGRDRLQRTRRRPLDQRRGDHRDRGRVRRGARMGAGTLVGPPAPPHERLRQLSHGRRQGADPQRLRSREVRPAEGLEASL